jgi:DNA polymerase I-like protein with 3'-5' exonuclease and polymerase domains
MSLPDDVTLAGEDTDDLYTRVVATVMGIAISKVTPEQRAFTKQVCFGVRDGRACVEQLTVCLHLAKCRAGKGRGPQWPT